MEFSLPPVSSTQRDVSHLGYARKVKPNSSTNPAQETVPPNYTIRGKVPNRWMINGQPSFYVRKFSFSDSVNSGPDRKLVVEKTGEEVPRYVEVEKLSITLDNPVGTLDAGTIAAGSAISAFEKENQG